jgi:hypothetical protein
MLNAAQFLISPLLLDALARQCGEINISADANRSISKKIVYHSMDSDARVLGKFRNAKRDVIISRLINLILK